MYLHAPDIEACRVPGTYRKPCYKHIAAYSNLGAVVAPAVSIAPKMGPAVPGAVAAPNRSHSGGGPVVQHGATAYVPSGSRRKAGKGLQGSYIQASCILRRLLATH